MARSPNCIVDVVRGHRMLRRKPRVEGSFDAGRSSMRLRENKRPEHRFALTALSRSIDTKVEAGKRPRSRRIPFKHHFRLGQILAPFVLVCDHRQHGHSGHAILEVASLVVAAAIAVAVDEIFDDGRRLAIVLCPHSSLGSRHAACRQAFRLTGRQIWAAAPKRRLFRCSSLRSFPSQLRSRRAGLSGCMKSN